MMAAPGFVKYLTGAPHLGCLEGGAYIMILGAYAGAEGPIPDDDATFARIVKCTHDEWLSVRPAVEKLFVIANGEWRHPEMDADIAKFYRVSKARSAAASKRWSNR